MPKCLAYGLALALAYGYVRAAYFMQTRTRWGVKVTAISRFFPVIRILEIRIYAGRLNVTNWQRQVKTITRLLSKHG